MIIILILCILVGIYFLWPIITDETKTDFREYTIPKKEREQSIFGGKYELKLMNELTQKAIARECADWIRRKAQFKSINIETDEMPNGIRIENSDDVVAVDRLKNFDRKELGYEASLFKTSRNLYHAPLSLNYLDEFDNFWEEEKDFDFSKHLIAQLDEKDNNFKTFLKEFLETKYYTPPNKSSLKENDFDFNEYYRYRNIISLEKISDIGGSDE